MGRRVALWLVLPFMGVVLACALSPSAGAYTHVVRPNTTISSGSWTVVPSGTIDSVLDDNVLSPTVPALGDDLIQENGNGPVTFEVGLSDVALRGGESITSVRSWAYAATGDGRSLDSQLRTGATPLVSATWPSNSPASWQSMTFTGSLTQAEVNDLRQHRTLQGSGASTNTTVYASYAEVATDMPPPTPSITAGPGVAGQGTSPSWSFTSTLAGSFECELDKDGATIATWSACTSAKSYDLAPTGDGVYTFKVRGLDDLGGAGSPATSTYTLDRVAPAAPTIDSGPPADSNNPLAMFAFTGESGALHSCRLERADGSAVAGFGLCTSPESYDLSGEADGDFTFRVHSTDMAGNAGPETTRTFTLDTDDPSAATITAPAPASGNSPSWSFTHEAGATAECLLERGATVVSGWAPCTSPRAFDLSAQPEGAYTFSVRVTDGAGNVSSDATDTYQLDRTPPAAPAITGGPTGSSQSAAPSYTFTADAGTTTECRLVRGATVVDDWGACVSPRGYDLALQPDGTYTFHVRARDAAGNPSTDATRSYTLDRAAPAAPVIVSGPAAESSDDTPTYTFTAEPGATTACRVERGATVVADWAPCTSAHTANLAAQVDGGYTFRVRATDGAANTGPEATHAYTLDRGAPAPPTITGGPTGDSQNATPSYTFSAGAGETTQCRMERGATVVSDWAACSSPRSYNLSAEVDGTYTFRVRALDGAANVGGDSSQAYALDRTAPSAPALTSSPPATGNGTSPSWSFTGDLGTSAECRLQRGGTVVSDWAPCASPRSYAIAAEPDGTYTFRVRSTDAAGNTGADTSGTYLLDRGAPAAPTITGGQTGDSQNATPSYAFTAEAGATFECRMVRGASVVSDWAACSSGHAYNLSAQADGAYTFSVRAIDAAGNTGTASSRSYTLDRVAPAAPPITGGPPASGADPAPSFSFTHEAGANASCRVIRGATVVSAYAACASPKGYDLAAEPDGTYTFSVRATDPAGNTSAETTRNYVLDRVEPVAPTITARPPAVTNDGTPTWTFTASFDVVKYRCHLDRGATVVHAYAVCASPHTYDLSALPDGTYTFGVRGSDDAANESTETQDTFTLDRAAPAAPAITGGPTGASANAAPSYTFTAEAGAATECRIDRGATVVSDWAACVSPRAYDLTLQPDATYTFRVRATDTAGNTGAEATRSYTLDRTAPAAPTITSGPAADSNDDTPVYSFTGEIGAAFSCRLERGAAVVSAWAPCSTPTGYDLTGDVDGSYTFRVRATDAAGNQGAETARTYALDRSPPAAPTLTATPGADTNDETPTWAFGSPAGTTTSCRLERGATVVSNWAACATPRTYDLSSEPQGTYTFRVRATDAAGNTGAETAHTTTLDRTAPAAPVITGGPLLSTADPTPAFSFTYETGATASCRLERGATVVSDWAACASPRSYDLAAQADGAYTFRVRATDVAGNTGADATRAFTLDRQAPNQPSISGRPPASTNDETPTWTWTGDADSSDNCRITRGATVVVDWTICSSPRTFDLSGQPDATYTFRVRSSDVAGNISTEANDTFALDRSAPAAPVVTGGPTGDSSNAAPSYSFTAEGGASTACRIERGTTTVSDWSPCVSPRSYDLSLQPDATYTFRVRATDAAGNTGAESTRSYNLDRSAPAAPTITSGPTGDSQDDTPTYSWTAEIGSASTCRVERGATVVADWAPCSTPHTHDLSAQVDGAYTFRVRATDTAGNVGADSARTYTLDRAAPASPTIASGPTSESSDDTPTFGFTGEAGAAFECRVDRGATTVAAWGPCASPRTYDIASEPDGAYSFRVRATDAAGNTGAPATRTYTLDRVAPGAPTVTTRPAGDSSDDTPTWGWTADADAVSYRCRVERGAAVVSDWAACTDPRTFALGAEPDGAYTFRVRASDTAGNEGAAATDTYTLDRAAPAAPSITAGPTGDSQDDTPTFAWTSEAGSSSSCRVERGATVVSDWSSCSSAHTPVLTAQVDGVYTFRVRATDAAANTGADAARTYTLDRTAPAAPAITSGPAADSTDDSPTYGFTAEAGASLACRLERGATVVDGWGPCTSPKIYDVGAEPDGTYTFRVRATDAAGNTGADATRDYTLDRTVPAAPAVDARPGDDGNDRTPEWAFSTSEPAKTFECRLARGAAVLSDWGPCVSPRQFDLSLEPDGTYTFGARAVNAAGTRSPATTDQYRLDTAAPAAPVVSGGPAPDSTDATPTWTVTAEPGAALACRLERGATVVSDWAPCSSPQGYNLAGEPDATYTFLTRATDAAGNTGAAGSASYTLDRTIPVAPVMGTNPPAAGSDATPTWAFTGEPGKTFECRLTRGSTVVADWAPCTSPHTPDLTAEPDGSYTLDVRAVNAAGTRSAVTSDDYDLDRATPVAPVITNGPPSDSADDTPTWSFTGEAAASFACRVERGATLISDWAACTDPETSDLNAEPDGTYTFRVRQSDPAGNTSPDAARSYTLDRTVPAVPTIDSRPASPGADTTPEWTLSGTAGLSLECRLTRGADVVGDWAACASPRTYDLSSEPDATYTLHARQYNAAGTRGPEVRDAYVLDVTAPAPPEITGAPGTVGNGSDPAWSFTAESGATVECRLERGGVEVRPWAPCASPRTFGLAGEPDGDYTFSVRATDAAGNRGAPATNGHRVDRVPPAPPEIGDNPGALGRTRAPGWSFTAEAGATFECTLAGAQGAIDEWALCASPRGYDLVGQPDGSFAFGVRARDAAGNMSPTSTSAYTLDTTPGAVTIDGGPGALGRDRRPAWRFSGEDGSSFECRLSLRDVPVADWNPCTSPRGFELAGRPDGTFSFSLRAIDPAGNVGPIGSAAYELDTTPPEAPTIERRPESPGTDRTPTWRFDGEKDATFTCRVETAESGAVSDWTLCASPFTADLAREENGRYRFLVRASDVAGNTGEPSTGAYELVPPTPAEDPPTDGGDKGKTGDVPVEEPAAPLTRKPRAPKAKPKAARKAKPRERTGLGLADPRRKPTPRSTAPVTTPEAPEKRERGGNFATRAVSDAVNAITKNPDKSVFPLSLLLLVLAFLAIQNRIDRSDPKLALAPTFADPDLEFRPPPGDPE